MKGRRYRLRHKEKGKRIPDRICRIIQVTGIRDQEKDITDSLVLFDGINRIELQSPVSGFWF